MWYFGSPIHTKYMKNLFFVGLFILSLTGLGHAQQISYNGKPVAEIKGKGDLYIHGKFVGLFDASGDVYKNGQLIGRIKPNGEFWTGGSRSGRINADDGTIYVGNAVAGKVQHSGDVYEGDKKIALGRGVKREWLAGIFFFYFKEEVRN